MIPTVLLCALAAYVLGRRHGREAVTRMDPDAAAVYDVYVTREDLGLPPENHP